MKCGVFCVDFWVCGVSHMVTHAMTHGGESPKPCDPHGATWCHINCLTRIYFSVQFIRKFNSGIVIVKILKKFKLLPVYLPIYPY